MSRPARPWVRHYAGEQILADLRKWQAAYNRRICDAIAALPTRQPTRKETGQ